MTIGYRLHLRYAMFCTILAFRVSVSWVSNLLKPACFTRKTLNFVGICLSMAFKIDEILASLKDVCEV